MSGFRFIEEAPTDGLERDVGPGATIGRAEGEVELNDPDVSRRHAVLRQIDDGLGIEDLGSKNGTFVNDRRVSGIVPVGAGVLKPSPSRYGRHRAISTRRCVSVSCGGSGRSAAAAVRSTGTAPAPPAL